MGKALSWVAVALLAVGVVACGDDDDDSGGGSAAAICMDQIACGDQLVDQAGCVQLYEAFLTPTQMAACEACVKKEDCATQETACESACTAQ